MGEEEAPRPSTSTSQSLETPLNTYENPNIYHEKQELAERVMVTRLHPYGKWVKKCNHAEIYQEISHENLALMRERLKETVIWPSDDTNTEKIG